MLKSIITVGCVAVLVAAGVCGCTTAKTTTTARTATEQLLLSTAADHALRDADLNLFRDRKVFPDPAYFDSYDGKYVEGGVRDALSRAGALMADNAGAADLVMESRSGAYAIDEVTTMFGIPAFTLPLPLSGPVETPEIAFYKSNKQRGVGKFALLAYNRQSGAHVYSSGPMDGTSFDNHFRIFFISWTRTDIPEKQRTSHLERKSQIWYPQYDLDHLPGTNAPATNAPATNAPAK